MKPEDRVNVCTKGHPCITYSGDACPLCKANKQLEILLDKNRKQHEVIIRQNIKLKKLGAIKYEAE